MPSDEVTRRVAIDVTIYPTGAMFLMCGSGTLTLDDGSERLCGSTGGNLVVHVDPEGVDGRRMVAVDAVQLWRAIEASGYIEGAEPLRYPALTASEMGTIVYWLDQALHRTSAPELLGRIEAALAKVQAAGLGHQPEHTAAPAETVAE